MNCPDCRNQLIPVSYENLTVRFCEKCKGYFLDEKQLLLVQQTRQSKIDRKKKHSKRRMETVRKCPVCRVNMVKVSYGKFIPKIIDKCPQCENVWLDKGELEDIQVAYEMYEENVSKKQPVFACPRCGFKQKKSDECKRCGTAFPSINLKKT